MEVRIEAVAVAMHLHGEELIRNECQGDLSVVAHADWSRGNEAGRATVDDEATGGKAEGVEVDAA